jgi:hypothetical protein
VAKPHLAHDAPLPCPADQFSCFWKSPSISIPPMEGDIA